MRFLLYLWFILVVGYGFGYYAGFNASHWWDGLPFFGTSLITVVVVYYGRTRPWRKDRKND